MDHSDRRMEVPAENKATPARRFDRADGLIVAAATIAAMLGAQLAHALEPLPPEPLVPSLVTPIPPAAPGLPPPSFAGPPAPSPPLLVPALPPGTVAPSPSGSATDEPVLAPVALEPGVVQRVLELSRPYLMAWTLAILILGLRRPRPSRCAEFRQPGMAACGVATLVLAVQLSAILLRWAVEWSWAAADAWRSHRVWSLGATPASALQDLWLSIHAGFIESAGAGHAIAGAWLIMVLGGWWRPEPSAIDRLGRALGVAWIAVMAARVVQNFGVYVW